MNAAHESESDLTAAADLVAAAVLSVPGVSALHAGSFGEVGTYLPGRRVAGVRIGDTSADVHIAVRMGSPVLEVADRVVAAVQPLVQVPVHVVVEDVIAQADAIEGTRG